MQPRNGQAPLPDRVLLFGQRLDDRIDKDPSVQRPHLGPGWNLIFSNSVDDNPLRNMDLRCR